MATNRNIRVAVVDDDESLCKAVSRLLGAAGIEVTTYFSAEGYLDHMDSFEADCIILDVHLGGMSGFDLHRHLTMIQKSLPVIFITAYDETETRRQAQRLGCVAYLRKTDPGQAVIEAINQAVSPEGREAVASPDSGQLATAFGGSARFTA